MQVHEVPTDGPIPTRSVADNPAGKRGLDDVALPRYDFSDRKGVPHPSNCATPAPLVLQPTPDLSITLLKKDFGTVVTGLPFKGPGWYYSKNSTILVIPNVDPATMPFGLWKQTWPDDACFMIHVWNIRHHSNFFNTILNAPTREAM